MHWSLSSMLGHHIQRTLSVSWLFCLNFDELNTHTHTYIYIYIWFTAGDKNMGMRYKAWSLLVIDLKVDLRYSKFKNFTSFRRMTEAQFYLHSLKHYVNPLAVSWLY